MKKKTATKKAQTKKQPDRTENTKPTRTRGLCECGALVNTDFPWMQVHKPGCRRKGVTAADFEALAKVNRKVAKTASKVDALRRELDL